MSQPFFRLLAAVLLVTAVPASALEMHARLGNTNVDFGEPVVLILETEGETDAGPDLTVLGRDFEIVNRRTQHSISIVNGQRLERNQLTLTLIPRRSGELEVPPIPFGDTATLPLQLSVGDAPTGTAPSDLPIRMEPPVRPAIPVQPLPADPPINPEQPNRSRVEQQTSAAVIETSVEPDRVRVGEQIVLTARIFTDASVLRSQLRDPQITNATVLPLGEDRYEAPWNGERRSVYERRYALFPMAPGRVEIEPLVFEGWTRGDGVPSAGFPYLEQPVRALSQDIGIEVLPAVTGEDVAGWLPARSLSLTEAGPATYRVRAGQPLERRIGLRADGLMSSSLPDFSVDVPYQLTKARRQPRLWDERRPQGVIGTRQEVIALTTEEPGQYRLPPLQLQWWNTGTGNWETAMLPARELVVTPAAFGEPGVAPPTEMAPVGSWSAPSPVGSLTDATTPQALPEPARMQVTEAPPPGTEPGRSSLWIWLTSTFALAWIATMAAWWNNKRRTDHTTSAETHSTTEREPEDPLSETLASVRSAYEADDAAGAREALLSWGAQVLPEAPPSNLARLAQRCPEPLRGQILMLEQAFFSPQPLPWERQRVWEHMRHFQPTPAEEPASYRRPKPLRRHRTETDSS